MDQDQLKVMTMTEARQSSWTSPQDQLQSQLRQCTAVQWAQMQSQLLMKMQSAQRLPL
jgi:hypothetical protein